MRGSQWNKWNLHVHTKGTNKNDQFTSATMDEFFGCFFKEAIKKNIKAIGITDYFTIDNYRKAIEYASLISTKSDDKGAKLFTEDEVSFVEGIYLFPNVELRMMPSTGAGKLINIHCIFNPEYVADLENDFFNTIENQDRFKMNRNGFIGYGKHLKPELENEQGLVQLGIDNFVIDPKTVKEIIDKNSRFRDNTIVVVSNSNKDGNSGLQKHYDLFDGESGALDGVRKTIYHISNAVFSANPKDVKYFLGKRIDETPGATFADKAAEIDLVIRNTGSLKSCLVGCDAHTEKDLFTRFTWIKGNLSFDGLKQILFEPEQRVKIQDVEPDTKEDKLVIDEVRFLSSDNRFTPLPIKFNKNLNVIIGGKSSGKSILLYNIAKTLLADRKILRNETAPFNYKYEFGDLDFEVTILSGQTEKITRSDEQPSILSEIKYIPQNYLSKLAEPENKKGNELLKLVRELLLEDDEYKSKYQEFLSQIKSNDLSRESMINNFFEIQAKIISLKTDLVQKGNEQVLTANIKSNDEKITKLKEGVGLSEEQIKDYNKLNGEHEQIEIEIRKIRSDYSKISSFNTDTINILRELIQRKNLTLTSFENDDIKSHYESEYAKLDLILQSIAEIINQIQLDTERRFVNDNPFKSLFSVKSKRSLELKEQLKPFVQNLEIKKQIEDLEKLIIEDKQKLSVINQIKLEIKNNETALLTEKEKIFSAYKENYEEYNKIVVQLDDRTQLLKNDNLKIEGKPRVNFPRLREKILDLSDGRKASYNSYSIFDFEKTGITDFTIDDFISQLKSVFVAIAENKDYALNSKVDLKNAIKVLLNDYFFDYWEVIYDNDTLTKMSTGKASFVILMLIVGLSKSKAPILIDQPEDNLDNRSITKDLVEYLRHKKLERQIILVTHNPNVVVNADAENIIVANQKGQNDKITTSPYDFDYVNGSIENTKSLDKNETDLLKSMGIREHIADIVEGGKEAFKKRERKYGFKDI